MIIVKEALETHHLPAALTGKSIGQSLKLRKHHILHIIIVKDRFEHEAVLTLVPDSIVTSNRIVEQSLACRLWSKIDGLLAPVVRH